MICDVVRGGVNRKEKEDFSREAVALDEVRELRKELELLRRHVRSLEEQKDVSREAENQAVVVDWLRTSVTEMKEEMRDLVKSCGKVKEAGGDGGQKFALREVEEVRGELRQLLVEREKEIGRLEEVEVRLEDIRRGEELALAKLHNIKNNEKVGDVKRSSHNDAKIKRKGKKISPKSKLENLLSGPSHISKSEDNKKKQRHISKKFLRKWMDNQDWVLRQLYLQMESLQDNVTAMELVPKTSMKKEELRKIVKKEMKKVTALKRFEKHEGDKHKDLENMVKEMFTDTRDLMKTLELRVVRVEDELQQDRETVNNIMEKVEKMEVDDKKLSSLKI